MGNEFCEICPRGSQKLHSPYNYGGRFTLPKKIENPFKMGYDLELDTSPE